MLCIVQYRAYHNESRARLYEFLQHEAVLMQREDLLEPVCVYELAQGRHLLDGNLQ